MEETNNLDRKPEVPEETIQFFAEQAGLTRDRIADSYSGTYSIPLDRLKERFAFLGAYEELDAPRVVRKFPVVLGYDTGAFASRMQIFHDLGFDAVALVNRKPTILSHSPETVADRFAGLAKRGLDAHKIIKFIPGALGVSEERLDNLFNYLESEGQDPRKVINAVPAILPLSIDPESESSLPAKIKNLEEMGLDSRAIVGKYPKILSCSPASVREKFEVIKQIMKGLGSSVGAEEAVLNTPMLLSRSSTSMWAAAQLALVKGSYSMGTPAEVTRILETGPNEAILRLMDHTGAPRSVTDRKTFIFEQLLDADVRTQVGAFAVLNYVQTLPAMQQQSIKETGDIWQLPVVAN